MLGQGYGGDGGRWGRRHGGICTRAAGIPFHALPCALAIPCPPMCCHALSSGLFLNFRVGSRSPERAFGVLFAPEGFNNAFPCQSWVGRLKELSYALLYTQFRLIGSLWRAKQAVTTRSDLAQPAIMPVRDQAWGQQPSNPIWSGPWSW